MNSRIPAIALCLLVAGACDSKPTPAPAAKAPRAEADKPRAAASAAPSAASPAAVSPPTSAPVAGAVSPTPQPVAKKKLPPLPDGTFTGAMRADKLSGEITLIVRDGVLVSATTELLAKERLEFRLKSRGGADSPQISLIGSIDNSFVQLLGGFSDGERASGTFDGTVMKKRVNGRWYAIRR